MSRNVAIIVIIGIIVLLAAYLVWLRGQYVSIQPTQPSEEITVETPVPESTASATEVNVEKDIDNNAQ